ncbi:MAG TPA: transglutaminase family protein, partial [Acidimicrobiales bacterium]|nr:transglutaminase family protein [Acidimicrobiales bacterium]
AIEVGRRVDVPIVGIGLPGHFLVRDATDEDAYADPFNGTRLDRSACRSFFVEHQGDAPFDESYLSPLGTRAIISRLLANLKGIHLARRDRKALIDVLELRVMVPDTPLDEWRELASALAADGRLLDAAKQLDALAEHARAANAPKLVEQVEREAIKLRARLN